MCASSSVRSSGDDAWATLRALVYMLLVVIPAAIGTGRLLRLDI